MRAICLNISNLKIVLVEMLIHKTTSLICGFSKFRIMDLSDRSMSPIPQPPPKKRRVTKKKGGKSAADTWQAGKQNFSGNGSTGLDLGNSPTTNQVVGAVDPDAGVINVDMGNMGPHTGGVG